MTVEEKVNSILKQIELDAIDKNIAVLYCNNFINCFDSLMQANKYSNLVTDADIFNYQVCKKILEVID